MRTEDILLAGGKDTTNAAVTARMALAAAEASNEISTVTLANGVVLHNVPESRKLLHLAEYLPAPVRTKGTVAVNDSTSFITMLERFPSPPPLVRFSKERLHISAVFNASSGAAGPGWEDHTCVWQLARHRDLLAWQAVFGKPLTQVALMNHLDDHLVDITDEYGGPTQSVIESVVAGLEITTGSVFQSRRDLHNDNFVLHNDSTSTPSVEVPRRFDIGLPIFQGLEHAYRVPVRLKYSIKEGSLTFTIQAEGFDRILDAAWSEVVETIIRLLPDGADHISVP